MARLGALIALALAVAVASVAPRAVVIAQSPLPGPAMAIANVHAIDATRIGFDVVTSGASPSPYVGWQAEISWNPAVFRFDSADVTGTQFSDNGICLPPDDSTSPPPAPYPAAQGSFVNDACTLLTTPGLEVPTRLVSVTLSVIAPGCSYIHLVTFGAPDGGGVNAGSYTVADDFSSPQQNSTVDSSSDSAGAPCATGVPLDLDDDGYSNAQEEALGKDPNVYCTAMRADVNSDGVVNILDLGAVAGFYQMGVPTAPQRYDQGPPPMDNVINILDLSKMGSVYRQSVTTCT